MKTFEEFRALIGGKGNKQIDRYKYKPETREELIDAIENEIEAQGPDADLNCIDTSGITDMSGVFSADDNEYAKTFNGDISKWDVSNVKNFSWMFYMCDDFDCDLSNWDVSKSTNMLGMFSQCSSFNKDLANWDTSNVYDMSFMFNGCAKFNGDISGWDTGSVEDMTQMFDGSKAFNQNISNWNTSSVSFRNHMFDDCNIKEEYKPKFN